ncbi:unnamed protein product [Paramecium pentaurelia]|uniref:Uncharacterized protein n=1 Tax=Paramecium pentaurelia TaxID=43138 RepID=A0A8S1U0Y0_9CILI|nr:unnamed protein product [Paramecium pentaurelia]
MVQELQQILNYQEILKPIHEYEQIKQQSGYDLNYIYEQIQTDQEFLDLELKIQFHKLQNQNENQESTLFNLIKINQCFIQYVNILQKRNQVNIKFQLIDKYHKNFFYYLQHQLSQNQNHIKVYLDKGHINFSFSIYVNQNTKIEQLKQFIKNNLEMILNFINKYEKQKMFRQSSKINSIKLNIVQSKPLQKSTQLIQKQNVRLFEYLKVVNCEPESQTLITQIIGYNNLLKIQYKNSVDIDKSLLLLIQNGELQNLEKKINSLLKSFDINIQEIISNLFSKIYLECQLKNYYQFIEFQTLSEYFNNQQQQQDTFEIRIQLLIQILCIYLLKRQLNLDLAFPQKDVIIIDSKKQIKLDMFAYLKYTSIKNEKLEQSEELYEIQEIQEIFNYFQFLFPLRVIIFILLKEKQVIIENYNITKELENMKQQIKENKINLYFFISQLIEIEKLIKQQLSF